MSCTFTGGWDCLWLGRGARRAGLAAWLQGSAGHCFLRRSSPPGQRHYPGFQAGGRLFIALAARVTEPGRADGAADALGLGAEGAGCARAATMALSARLPGRRGRSPTLLSIPRPHRGGGLLPPGSARRPARPDCRRSWSPPLDHSALGDAATWGWERRAGNVYWTGLGTRGGPGTALPGLLSRRCPASM